MEWWKSRIEANGSGRAGVTKHEMRHVFDAQFPSRGNPMPIATHSDTQTQPKLNKLSIIK